MEMAKIYIDGRFVDPHGTAWFDLHDPYSGAVTGRVRLGDAEDARAAIAAARRALPGWSRSTKDERLALLERMHAAVLDAGEALQEAVIAEFGIPVSRSREVAAFAADAFRSAARALELTDFEPVIGRSRVRMLPVGVAALITPWNASAFFVCGKLAYAIAAGCTAVIKPSEMSARQTQVVLDALHGAGAPAGLFNVVNGLGDTVGAEFATHPDVAKVSFTGSVAVGKVIQRAAADTLKRLTLELGGKSPTIVLDDADLAAAMPAAAQIGMMNNGQACLNGTRILVPEARRDEALAGLKAAVEAMQTGDPRDPATAIGPLVSRTQYDRVQRYIRAGIDGGATLVTGGEGHPEGSGGYTVRPTVFADVTNDMVIAREEIFGPVLCVLTYRDEEEAIRIANDSSYGLFGYVFGRNVGRARAVAERLEVGTVAINGAAYDMEAPFGGMKQSGVGREKGVVGLRSFLEPQTMLEPAAA